MAGSCSQHLGTICREAGFHGEKVFVHFLYEEPAFDYFDDFVESITSKTSKSCQVRGSNPCPGSTGIACVKTKRKKSSGVNFRLGFIEVYQRGRPVPAHPPTRLPTQNSYRWNSTPPILFDGGRGGRI